MIQETATVSTPGATTPRSRFFDPEQVACFEKAGWEAYYERKWPRVLSLMVQLHREQFGMSLPLALSAALDIARASRAFAPQDHDLLTTLEHLRRYYAKARRARPIRASADTLARLELAYWIVHRRLAMARKADPGHSAPIDSLSHALALLHAALFNATPEAMRPSAELRARATVAVDRITGGYSTDVAADWQEVERLLQGAYRAAQQAMRARRTRPYWVHDSAHCKAGPLRMGGSRLRWATSTTRSSLQ